MECESTFSCTYSARENQEIQAIRSKYLPKEEDKMEQLRKLDRIPVRKAQAYSITQGTVGTLIMGTGMSLAMSDLGMRAGDLRMVAGISIGLAGMLVAAPAYRVFNRILSKEREKIAPEVLKLTEELMK